MSRLTPEQVRRRLDRGLVPAVPVPFTAMTEIDLDAQAGGAHAFLVHPPSPFRRSPDLEALVLDYHQQLARLGAPLILFYLYEAAGGIAYSPELLRRLLALPQVVGIKLATLDSVMT